jgi:hypothetical protein
MLLAGRAEIGLDPARFELVAGTERKASGAYYTPATLVAELTKSALAPMLRERLAAAPDAKAGEAAILGLRICDPACGSGRFLVAAARLLGHELAALRVGAGGEPDLPALRDAVRDVIREVVFGVDRDPLAVDLCRAALWLEAGDPTLPLTFLDRRIRCGDSLVGVAGLTPPETVPEPARHPGLFHWPLEFPEVFAAGGFDVVLGNPPWGQKAIDRDSTRLDYLKTHYATLGGIFDWFRPFLERGLAIARPGGILAQVLPDTILLKNYEPTRRLLLIEGTVEELRWLGMAFPGATIDVCTLVARKRPAPPDHVTKIRIGSGDRVTRRETPQREFLANPRAVFNIFLTAEQRQLLARIEARSIPLGELAEIHEGVHSGNMRTELFLPTRPPGDGRPLLRAGVEVAPFRIAWRGGWIDLAAFATRAPGRYGNLGRASWHERAKLLVRRTGDRIIAAVDEAGYFASNNFFLVLPRDGEAGGPGLDALAALLNTSLATGWFRMVEPRTGRAFAELKIKHLAALPVPSAWGGAGAAEAAARRLRAGGPQHVARLRREVEQLLAQAWEIDSSSFPLATALAVGGRDPR